MPYRLVCIIFYEIHTIIVIYRPYQSAKEELGHNLVKITSFIYCVVFSSRELFSFIFQTKWTGETFLVDLNARVGLSKLKVKTQSVKQSDILSFFVVAC